MCFPGTNLNIVMVVQFLQGLAADPRLFPGKHQNAYVLSNAAPSSRLQLL